MKKLLLILTFLLSSPCFTFSQQVNGVVLSDSGNLKVVKIWGSHYERGFAYGYLCSQDIMSVWNNFIVPGYGTYLPLAKMIIGNDNYFSIDTIYVTEAKAILDGIGAAGADTAGLTYLDLFVVNFLTDLQGFMAKGLPAQNCSSLLDWGDATLGTDLNGKSVIAHHLDADQSDTALLNNQVLVIHIPSEPDEQPWLLTGTAGQMVASQTVNSSGLCVFLNTVNGFSAQTNMHYEPVTLAIRKAVESADYNGDAVNNVNDIRQAISSNINGYASGFIVCAIAPSTVGADSLIGGIIEMAPQQPYITFRNVDFPDSLAGDNLYAANSMIKRSAAYDFCSRYINVSTEINNTYGGQSIGSQDNWDIMVNKSTQNSNLQLIQVIPEDRIFKIAVRDTANLAYQKIPMVFNMDDFFSSTGINETNAGNNILLSVYPNPGKEFICIEIANNKEILPFEILNVNGQIIYKSSLSTKTNIELSAFTKGIYLLKVYSDDTVLFRKFIKL